MTVRTKPLTEVQMFLIRLVEASGVPQAIIAERTGFSQKHVSEMMTGTVEGSLTAWQRIFDVVGVTL